MITVPPSIQAQLGDAVSVIADSDFWERWDTLVDVRIPCAELHGGEAVFLAKSKLGPSLATHPRRPCR